MNPKEDVVKRLREKITLKNKIRVNTEIAFLNLPADLGLREDKGWTFPEDEKLFMKIMSLAHKHSDHIMDLINEKK